MNVTSPTSFDRPRFVSDVVIGKLDRKHAADLYLRWEPWFGPNGSGVTFASIDDAISAAKLASREMTKNVHVPNATIGVFGSDAAFGIAYVARSDASGTARGIHSNLGTDRERAFTNYDETLRALVNAAGAVLVGPPGTTTTLSTH